MGTLRKNFPIFPINFLKFPFKSKFILTLQTITLCDCSQDSLIFDLMTMKKKLLVYKEVERRKTGDLY